MWFWDFLSWTGFFFFSTRLSLSVRCLAVSENQGCLSSPVSPSPFCGFVCTLACSHLSLFPLFKNYLHQLSWCTIIRNHWIKESIVVLSLVHITLWSCFASRSLIAKCTVLMMVCYGFISVTQDFSWCRGSSLLQPHDLHCALCTESSLSSLRVHSAHRAF